MVLERPSPFFSQLSSRRPLAIFIPWIEFAELFQALGITAEDSPQSFLLKIDTPLLNKI